MGCISSANASRSSVVEHAAHLVQQRAGVFESLDGVLERRCLGVVDDGINGLVLLFDTTQEGRLVMLGLDTVEWNGAMIV